MTNHIYFGNAAILSINIFFLCSKIFNKLQITLLKEFSVIKHGIDHQSFSDMKTNTIKSEETKFAMYSLIHFSFSSIMHC